MPGIDGGFESIALEMLTGKPAINIGISEAGTHQPYGILTGPDEKQVTHASVYLRKTGFDAHWGYWGQDASKPPVIQEKVNFQAFCHCYAIQFSPNFEQCP